MAAENVIRSVLVNDATVAALVSTRIRPDIAKANEALPFVVFEMIASNRYQAADGYTGLGQFTYEFRCMASTRSGATALSDAVRIALDHLATTTVSGQTIEVVTVLSSDESIEFRDEAGQVPVYVTSLDMDIFVREAVS